MKLKESLWKSLRKKREQYQKQGLIRNGVLQENVIFNSASAAAAFVIGRSANGKKFWCNKEGMSLKELEKRAQFDKESDVKGSELKLFLTRRVRKIGKITAQCRRTGEGFVLLPGSRVSHYSAPHLSTSLIQWREQMFKTGKIDQAGQLLEEVIFASASQAAMFVLGMSANGRQLWRDDKGQTLKIIEEKEAQRIKDSQQE